jgi:hypothetical protein
MKIGCLVVECTVFKEYWPGGIIVGLGGGGGIPLLLIFKASGLKHHTVQGERGHRLLVFCAFVIVLIGRGFGTFSRVGVIAAGMRIESIFPVSRQNTVAAAKSSNSHKLWACCSPENQL